MTDTLDADRHDTMRWQPAIRIEKWANEHDHAAGLPPAEVLEVDGNLLLNAGITRALNLIFGQGGQAFDATHCRIGVGDSSTAAAAGQTDLQAATNKYYQLVDSVAVASQTATIVATFAAGNANFAWQEWVIDNGTASSTTGTAPALNRKVASLGTKASPAVWVFTVTITLS